MTKKEKRKLFDLNAALDFLVYDLTAEFYNLYDSWSRNSNDFDLSKSFFACKFVVDRFTSLEKDFKTFLGGIKK